MNNELTQKLDGLMEAIEYYGELRILEVIVKASTKNQMIKLFMMII